MDTLDGYLPFLPIIQPTTFVPGVVQNAFSSQFQLKSQFFVCMVLILQSPVMQFISWTLNGTTVSASNDATKYCSVTKYSFILRLLPCNFQSVVLVLQVLLVLR